MIKLQKRSKFEEVVNDDPIQIITKPNYIDSSNDFHISNIRDNDYDIEKQILNNKKELIQSDIINEITTRQNRQVEKVQTVLQQNQQEIRPDIISQVRTN